MDSFQALVAYGEQLGYSQKLQFVFGTWFSHFAVFWGINFILLFFYRNNWFMKYRIQGNSLPPWKDVKECIRNELISHLLIQPLALWYVYPLFVNNGVNMSDPIPSIFIIIRDLIVNIAINDTMFYWLHRAMHHKSIYKYVHKHHHRFKVNVGPCAEFAHPVEDLLANTIPTVLGSMIMHSHPITLWCWICLRICETLEAHSGYEFPYSPFHFFSWQGGSARHDFHHSHNVGCFGSFTIFWDWFCETDKQFLAWKKGKEVKKED